MVEVPNHFCLKFGDPCNYMLHRNICPKCFGLKKPLLRSKGTKILAADNTTILVVAAPPEQHSARATVLLQAQEAKLQVTQDHRVVLANGQLAAWLKVNQVSHLLLLVLYLSVSTRELPLLLTKWILYIHHHVE